MRRRGATPLLDPTLTKTFEPKFTMLPKELVRHVVSFWLHAGYY